MNQNDVIAVYNAAYQQAANDLSAQSSISKQASDVYDAAYNQAVQEYAQEAEFNKQASQLSNVYDVAYDQAIKDVADELVKSAVVQGANPFAKHLAEQAAKALGVASDVGTGIGRAGGSLGQEVIKANPKYIPALLSSGVETPTITNTLLKSSPEIKSLGSEAGKVLEKAEPGVIDKLLGWLSDAAKNKNVQIGAAGLGGVGAGAGINELLDEDPSIADLLKGASQQQPTIQQRAYDAALRAMQG